MGFTKRFSGVCADRAPLAELFPQPGDGSLAHQLAVHLANYAKTSDPTGLEQFKAKLKQSYFKNNPTLLAALAASENSSVESDDYHSAASQIFDPSSEVESDSTAYPASSETERGADRGSETETGAAAGSESETEADRSSETETEAVARSSQPKFFRRRKPSAAGSSNSSEPEVDILDQFDSLMRLAIFLRRQLNSKKDLNKQQREALEKTLAEALFDPCDQLFTQELVQDLSVDFYERAKQAHDQKNDRSEIRPLIIKCLLLSLSFPAFLQEKPPLFYDLQDFLSSGGKKYFHDTKKLAESIDDPDSLIQDFSFSGKDYLQGILSLPEVAKLRAFAQSLLEAAWILLNEKESKACATISNNQLRNLMRSFSDKENKVDALFQKLAVFFLVARVAEEKEIDFPLISFHGHTCPLTDQLVGGILLLNPELAERCFIHSFDSNIERAIVYLSTHLFAENEKSKLSELMTYLVVLRARAENPETNTLIQRFEAFIEKTRVLVEFQQGAALQKLPEVLKELTASQAALKTMGDELKSVTAKLAELQKEREAMQKNLEKATKQGKATQQELTEAKELIGADFISHRKRINKNTKAATAAAETAKDAQQRAEETAESGSSIA